MSEPKLSSEISNVLGRHRVVYRQVEWGELQSWKRKSAALEADNKEADRLLLAAAFKYTALEARLSKMEEALKDIAVNAVTLDMRQLAKEALAGESDVS